MSIANRQNVVWALAAIYVGVQAIQALSGNAIPSSVFNAAITLSSFLAAIVHGSIRYDWRGILCFAAITLVISNGLENLSVVTGFPFGWYYYSVALGPKIVNVPVVIGFAYFSVGYLAWTIANAILHDADVDRQPKDWLKLALLSSFVMVGWDVAMDPLRSTAAGFWVWPNGGGYFGVPLTNFLGWFLTVFIVYGLFGLTLVARPNWVRLKQGPTYWYQAVALFAACVLPFFLAYFGGSGRLVRDARGTVWHVADMQESAVLICLFTMVFAAATAALCISRRSPRSIGA